MFPNFIFTQTSYKITLESLKVILKLKKKRKKFKRKCWSGYDLNALFTGVHLQFPSWKCSSLDPHCPMEPEPGGYGQGNFHFKKQALGVLNCGTRGLLSQRQSRTAWWGLKRVIKEVCWPQVSSSASAVESSTQAFGFRDTLMIKEDCWLF